MFTVTNTADIAGADVPQIYLMDAPSERRVRLLGFERVELAPRSSRTVRLSTDPRLLARFDEKANRWRIPAGTYHLALGCSSAEDLKLRAEIQLAARLFGNSPTNDKARDVT